MVKHDRQILPRFLETRIVNGQSWTNEFAFLSWTAHSKRTYTRDMASSDKDTTQINVFR